jgi:3-oxoacyl-[acyl-carrier protein] reductase
VAIVIGADHGIGRAIALRRAEEGAHVVAADIEAATAQEAASAIERLDWDWMHRTGQAINIDGGVMSY